MSNFHRWMTAILAVFLLFVVLAAVRPAKAAGAACGRADAIMATLADQFQLSPRWKGIAPSGNIYVILSTPKADRWVAIQIDPARGMACIMAEGMKNEFMIGQGA